MPDGDLVVINPDLTCFVVVRHPPGGVYCLSLDITSPTSNLLPRLYTRRRPLAVGWLTESHGNLIAVHSCPSTTDPGKLFN